MPVRDKQEIFALLAENESHLRRLGVRRGGLFGSFARGEQAEQSDVDILVEFEEGRKTFDNFSRSITTSSGMSSRTKSRRSCGTSSKS